MKKIDIQRKVDIVDSTGRYLRALTLDGLDLTEDRRQALVNAIKHLQSIELPDLLKAIESGE